MLGKETDADLKSEYKHLITEKRATMQSTPLFVLFKDRQFIVKLDLNPYSTATLMSHHGRPWSSVPRS